MQPKLTVQTRLAALMAGAVLIIAATAQADNTNTASASADIKSDPTGTWTWTVPARNGGADRTNTLTLKREGDKLEGKLSSPGRDGQAREFAIADGKIDGNKLSFSVTREFNGNSFTSKYSGQLSGDSLKGTIEFERDGSTQSRDWSAQRQPAAAQAPARPETSDKK